MHVYFLIKDDTQQGLKHILILLPLKLLSCDICCCYDPFFFASFGASLKYQLSPPVSCLFFASVTRRLEISLP